MKKNKDAKKTLFNVRSVSECDYLIESDEFSINEAATLCEDHRNLHGLPDLIVVHNVFCEESERGLELTCMQHDHGPHECIAGKMSHIANVLLNLGYRSYPAKTAILFSVDPVNIYEPLKELN